MSKRAVPMDVLERDRIPLLIDTDAANEIDDVYAIALAIRSTDRLDLRGFVATHFAARSGRESIQESFDIIRKTLSAAEVDFPVLKGGDPLVYPGEPQRSEGTDFIIDSVLAADPDDPLVVLGIGAASNLASAILLEPRVAERSVYMFHGRSEDTWPKNTRQFNVYGDVIATQVLLESEVPLIWFDTGTKLCASMEQTKERLEPAGKLGRFLHEFRSREDWFQDSNKGFFDIGDIAWLIDPTLCTNQTIDTPRLTRWLEFDFTKPNGTMLHVSSIEVERTWNLFYERLQRGTNATAKSKENES